MSRKVWVVVVLAALVGCEQQDQALPFDVAEAVTRTVGAQGGSVSTPAGAAVHFPTGSVTGTVEVSVSTSEVPTAVQSAGKAATGAFRLEPAGTELSKAADLELKLSGSDPEAWLATVVSTVNGDLRHYGSSRVDLSTGVVSAGIDRLGVVAAVIPPADAIFRVQMGRSVAALAPVAVPSSAGVAGSVERVSVECGDPLNPCEGLSVTASRNLLDLVEEAAVVFPRIEGAFEVDGGTVSGEVVASASLRVKFESGQTAESVEVNAVLRPTAATTVVETADEVIFTNVLHRISGATDSESETVEEVADLVLPKSAAAGMVTLERTFEIRVEGGDLESASIELTFPVTIN